MGKTAEELAELLRMISDEDIATLRALERQLNSLVEAKARDEVTRLRGKAEGEALPGSCPDALIDPELLSLVGIHPENPVQEDKALIREAITRRLED
jgi:hypothetical protein